jgi:hypothetical protein
MAYIAGSLSSGVAVVPIPSWRFVGDSVDDRLRNSCEMAANMKKAAGVPGGFGVSLRLGA